MNIFVLDTDPKKCAEYHNDKHVIKMILETAQLLCSAHHMTGSNAPYRLTHKNHPCSIWVRQSISNYKWLAKLGLELCKEYYRRYNKIHKTKPIIKWCIENIPNLPNNHMTNFVCAMPDSCKISSDPVINYREYYIQEKASIAKWKTQKPEWYE
jgi:hypothetical protein